MTAPSGSAAPPDPADPEDPYADEYGPEAARRAPEFKFLLDRRVLRTGAGMLRERVWIRALTGVVLLSVIFLLCGQWQWHRHVSKDAKIHRIENNYDATPVPLQTLLPEPSSAFPKAEEWRQVTVTGQYLPSEQLLVRNRPVDGDAGYEVLVPIRTASGDVFVVDRGGVPAGSTGAAPDSVAAPPSGTVTVTARIRPTEPHSGKSAPAGQIIRIDLPQIAKLLDGRYGGVYDAYGILASESPAAAQSLTPLPRPSTDGGPHVSYTVQWYAFTLAAYLLFLWFLLREAAYRVGVVPRQARRSADTP